MVDLPFKPDQTSCSPLRKFPCVDPARDGGFTIILGQYLI